MLKEALKKFSQDKRIVVLLILAIILIALRFVWLDKFPGGLNHDEADVVLSAKNYWLNGRDISGIKFPLSLFVTGTESKQAGLPSVLLASILGPLNLNLITARTVFALVNIVTGIFLALIVWRLSKNKVLSFITFDVFLANPWSFVYSRSAIDTTFALLFVLVGTYLLFSTSGKKIFYSLIFFIFMFYSYFGAKPILPLLLLPLLLIHKSFVGKTSNKVYIFYFLTFLLFFISYFALSILIQDSTYKSRSSELIFSNLDKYSGIVDSQRKLSLEFTGKGIFYNKFNSLFWDVANKYINVFSPDNLFFGGDPRATYRLGSHGMLYLLDFPFVILGVYGLGKIKKISSLTHLTLLFCLLGPIGSSISQVETSYMFRAFLLLPGLIIIISVGIYYFTTSMKGLLKYFMVLGIFILYLFLSLNFFYFYFFRFTITQQENNFLSERVLINYLMRTEDKKIVVVVNFPRQIFQQYLYFSGYLNNRKDMPQPKDGKYKLGNILITNDCKDVDLLATVITQVQIKCKNLSQKNFLTIQDEKDAGVLFRIYNDKICEGKPLSSWRRFHYVSDYAIEKLDLDSYCKRWVND